MNRRRFLRLVAAGAAGAIAIPARRAHAETNFRAISYNVLACRGYPETPGNRERIAAERGTIPMKMGEALGEFTPDLVTLQEAPPEEKVAKIATALGMKYAFFPGGWEGDDRYPGGFPGAVITRHAIVESESRPSAGAPHPERLFTRHLGRAKLDTPAGPLHVVSAHFHASDHPVRMEEAAAIVALIARLKESAPVLLLGDLNHQPADPEYGVWTGAGLVDIGAAHGIGEKPTFSSVQPRGRIDYIWATPDFAQHAAAAQVLDTPPFIPDAADETSYALSDHLPVLAEFRLPG